MTSDITPDILHMGVGEHGINCHVYSCNNLGVKVFNRNFINCRILVALTNLLEIMSCYT